MRRIVCLLMILCVSSCSSSHLKSKPNPSQSYKSWPYPIPCRIQDGENPELFMMTLGDVDTTLAQGVYDPVQDKVTLKDGTVKEHYYRDILGVTYYKPIDKTHFPLPPSGWCTWYYYYYRITAQEVKRNAKWISENLKDYGAQFVQIDDGWQRSPNDTRDWTHVHQEYFPDGMADVASYIKSVGLIPGIWLAPHGQSNRTVVDANPNVFLRKEDGTLDEDRRRWEGLFLVDPSMEESLKYMEDLFSTLCEWGYEYFKIDGQPPVVREYSQKGSFMKNPTDNTNELYRKTLESIRKTIGPDRYLLGCWGIPTEGIGIMDGSRTGGDIVLGWGGFQTALRAVMAYYYQHNIVWYVDPDVMVLRSPLTMEQARVWATLQGLTGQALMATDRMMDLSEDRVEILRRVYPAVDIRPLDLFPAQRNKKIWDLKINHMGRNYDVVGVFNFDENATEQMYLKWADLDLPTDKPIHVFDFWNKEYLGSWQAGMTLDMSPTSCRVLTLLPSNDQIQLISTNRHITQGWVDLISLKYDDANKTYSGKSRIIKNDPYEVRFVFPRNNNYAIKSVTARSTDGILPVTFANHQGWAAAKIHSKNTTEASWEVKFESTDIYHYPAEAPASLRLERVGLDGADLTWSEQYYLNVGYQVYLNGELLGYTPKAAFPLRGLDPKVNYTVGVETVWEDGTTSRNKAEQTFSIESMAPRQMSLNQLTPSSSGGRMGGRMRGFTGRRMGGAGNQTISVGEKTYRNAILTNPGMEITYDVKGLYDSFSAMVGIGDDSSSDNGVEFIVMGDGKELWRSASLLKADGLKAVNIEITGVKSLVLRAESQTDEAGERARGQQRRGRGQRNLIQAAWIDATLALN
ncbi:MAG: NPCBM/NEW2 domain-containing protein [Sedimentisphaerales bacterium]|nr:NPCBM/NEW2 domain-containing protein [Sedimentisphaerales bacterium]